jgi:hypothetical protein
MPYTAVMAAECAVRPLADRRTPWVEMPRVRWFDVDLPIHFVSPATEAWGIGRTCRISRDAVMFVPSNTSFSVGDQLRYLLLFPGTGGKPGAVGMCRGRIARADTVVVVTIDRCRLHTPTSARASRDARMRRLVGLCQDAHPDSDATAAASKWPRRS